jgi:quinol monooxygenase YgiN
VTADPIPPTAVIRVSRANFDPARFSQAREMTIATGRYLIPAIKKLPGLISYYAGVSPDGSAVHVSVWESDEHAQQMSRLKEMIVDAQQDAAKVGVTFMRPIVDYPIDWSI